MITLETIFNFNKQLKDLLVVRVSLLAPVVEQVFHFAAQGTNALLLLSSHFLLKIYHQL